VKIETPFLVIGGVAIAALLGGLAFWIWGGSSGETDVASGDCKPKETFEITAADYAEGKADAPITIIEYASMTCPHCARFTTDVLPQIKANYVEKGYVRYVYREFPLDRVALLASVAGRCLARDAYMPYIEMMYGEIQAWATNEDPRAAIKEMARRAGMSGDEFEKCVSTEDDAKKIVAAQSTAVKDYCIGGTPTFLMNGKLLGAREIPYEEFDEKFRAELKAKGVALPAAAATPAAVDGGTATDSTATPADGATPATGEATPAPATTTPPVAPASSTPATTPTP